MYDLRFIFDECGFGDVPDYIDRSRLFNVSFDLTSGYVKLYVLDASERFAHKITRDGITRQYSGDDPEHGGDHGRLERHLGCKLAAREIVIDAVEDETYYVYLDDAGVEQSLLFLTALCRVHGLTEGAVLQSINAVSGKSYASLVAALAEHAVSLVKVPLASGNVKVYARPFLRGRTTRWPPVRRACARHRPSWRHRVTSAAARRARGTPVRRQGRSASSGASA